MPPSALPFQSYRISKIPIGISNNKIEAWFPPQARANIQSLSQAIWTERDYAIAIITFSIGTKLLSAITPKSPQTRLSSLLPELNAQFSEVLIDSHFLGLTPLNDGVATGTSTTVDIIAVTGLNGRPYGSWQCEDGSMWLRDFLPRDIKVTNVRVFVYGYSSRVIGSSSHSHIAHFATEFLQTLEVSSRDRHVPLILIGHSLGGLLIKDAWNICASNSSSFYDDLRRSIYGLVFFGTPHDGMEADALITAAHGEASETLVRELHPSSSSVKRLRDTFTKAQRELRVVSCYEQCDTETLRQDDNGTWCRDGEKKRMVSDASACLYWHENREIRIPIDANHSMIAKLSDNHGSKYKVIKEAISKLCSEAAERIPNRFTREEIMKMMRIICDNLRKQVANPYIDEYGFMPALRKLSNNTEDIHKALSEDLNDKFLSEHTKPELLANFQSLAKKLMDLLLNKEFFGNFKGSMWDAFSTIQGMQHALSFCMLCKPVDFSLLEVYNSSNNLGLYGMAQIQDFLSSSTVDLAAPLNGTLKLFDTDNIHDFVKDILRSSHFSAALGTWHPNNKGHEQQVIVDTQEFSKMENGTVNTHLIAVTTLQAQRLVALLKKYKRAREEAGAMILENAGFLNPTTNTLLCLGYLVKSDPDTVHVLYEIPRNLLALDGGMVKEAETLWCYLQKTRVADYKMESEEKYKLAYRICLTVLDLFSLGWVHGAISSKNILVREHQQAEKQSRSAGFFDLKSRFDVYLIRFEFSPGFHKISHGGDLTQNSIRQPGEPRWPPLSLMKAELQGLEIVLLELGLEMEFSRMLLMEAKLPGLNMQIPNSLLNKLPNAMGTRYAEAVQWCHDMVIDLDLDEGDEAQVRLATGFQTRVVEQLRQGMKL